MIYSLKLTVIIQLTNNVFFKQLTLLPSEKNKKQSRERKSLKKPFRNG